MKGHFNYKSLAFYAVAIGTVVILFSVVTAYGESRLKAPANIEGRYKIPAESLPGCLQAEPLVLTVQQSGEYLHGSLLPEPKEGQKAAKASEKKASLNGIWENQKLVLSGPVKHLKSCNLQDAQAGTSGRAEGDRVPEVNIEGAIEEKTLKGQITITPSSGQPESSQFSVQRAAPVPKAEGH